MLAVPSRPPEPERLLMTSEPTAASPSIRTLPRPIAIVLGVVTVAAFGSLTYWIDQRFTKAFADSPQPLRYFPMLAVVTGVMLVVSRRAWSTALAGIAAGGLLVGLTNADMGPLDVIPSTAAAIFQVFTIAAAMEWLYGRPVELRRPSQAMLFLAVTALATLGAAVIAVTPFRLGLFGIDNVFDISLRTWFVGQFAETVVLVPVFLSFGTPIPRLTDRLGRIEALLAGACLALAVALALAVDFSFFFFVIPIVIWLAIRFGAGLAAPAAALMFMAMSMTVVVGDGPFSSADHLSHYLGFRMAMACSAVVTIALAQQAADDRFHLAATLEASPDTVALTDAGGRVVEVWGPRDHPLPRATLQNFVADATDRAGDQFRRTPDRQVFQHAWTTAHNRRQLHLIRDVTTKAALDEERRRRREEVELVRLAEQRRIGVRLHDGAVQDLSALLLRLGLVLDLDDPRAEIELLENRLSGVIDDLRSAANRLIPPDVGAGSVGEALRDLAQRLFAGPVVCEVDDQRWNHHSARESETLYLVGREALSNAAFHADPRRVRVVLAALPGRAVLSVADDGPGLAPTVDDRRHLGLQITRERLSALGGTLDLTTSEWGGLLLVATVPRLPHDSPVSRSGDQRGADVV